MAVIASSQHPTRRCLWAAVMLALYCSAVRADVEEISPADGHIGLTLAGAPALPLRYIRETGSGAICETASWDDTGFFGEVAYCGVIGDRFWRRGYVTIDLLLAHFPFLGDFMVAKPRPQREVVTAIGAMTLYAFAIEDIPGSVNQCSGFVRGYDSSGTGYRQFLVAYACADPGALEHAQVDAFMHGLSIKGDFTALLP